MADTIEVDREYLWALETVTVGMALQDAVGNDTAPVDLSALTDALDVVHGANLNRPRDRRVGGGR